MSKYDDEGKAAFFLKAQGFQIKNGIIYASHFRWVSDDESDAIKFLCSEWDYGYEYIAISNKPEQAKEVK